MVGLQRGDDDRVAPADRGECHDQARIDPARLQVRALHRRKHDPRFAEQIAHGRRVDRELAADCSSTSGTPPIWLSLAVITGVLAVTVALSWRRDPDGALPEPARP
jgi:hypothetical protein